MRTSRMTAALTCLLCLPLVGCIVDLTGSGEAGIGYRSETKIFGYHTVDGDKQGKEAKSELDTRPLVDQIIDLKDSTKTDEPSPEPTPNE